ncbi:MOSC domain-containing protein [Streptacidiphilus sp. EB103A]|uniref:MOSC domain-containing protein n=1 Tax=Streptacidiphilus sp. EB103A TaxID=3156275 RepID=UPI0035125C69
MRLTDLRIYPVKSFAPVPVRQVEIEPWGPAGDRRWMVVDAAGKMVSQREDPRLGQITASLPEPGVLQLESGGEVLRLSEPDGALLPVSVFGLGFELVDAGDVAAAWLHKVLGRELRLVHQDRPERRPLEVTTSLADAYPLLVTSAASLDALNELIARDHPDDPVKGAPVPMGRFRSNLVVRGAEAWAETGWRRIRVGEVEFEVVQQCGRCVMTTLDPETGERRGPEPLRALGRHRKFGRTLAFGMHLAPVGTGVLRVGDEVVVLAEGPLPEPERLSPNA